MIQDSNSLHSCTKWLILIEIDLICILEIGNLDSRIIVGFVFENRMKGGDLELELESEREEKIGIAFFHFHRLRIMEAGQRG